MADRLKVFVPEVWEQWAEKRQPFISDPERPQSYKDGTLIRRFRLDGTEVPSRIWLPSGFIIPHPMMGGARAFTSGSPGGLESTSIPISDAPGTLAIMFNTSSVTTDQELFAIGEPGGAFSRFTLEARGAQSGDPLTCRVRGTSSQFADTTSGFSQNTWHHATGVFASSADKRAYLDGGSKGTNTTSPGAVSNWSRISVGRIPGVANMSLSGDTAEAAVWSIGLSDAEVALTAKRVSPLMVRLESLVFYCPIIGKYAPEIEIIDSRSLTVSAATTSRHPGTLLPSSPWGRHSRPQLLKSRNSLLVGVG